MGPRWAPNRPQIPTSTKVIGCGDSSARCDPVLSGDSIGSGDVDAGDPMGGDHSAGGGHPLGNCDPVCWDDLVGGRDPM